MHKKVCIVLVGGPCSGKSSTGRLTAEKIGAKYISSGDIAREMAMNNAQVNIDLANGKMAPEDEMRNMMHKTITHIIDSVYDIVILDGFPRFEDQAKWLQDNFGDKLNIYYVLFRVNSLSAIIERSIGRNRDDDHDNSLRHRLEYFNNVTLKDLMKYIDMAINTDEISTSECSVLLTNFVKEVKDAKHCEI